MTTQGFLQPESILNEINIHGVMHVADFGAGAGHFAIAAAKKLGPQGRVHAFDVRDDTLEILRQNAARQHISNIQTARGDIERVGGTRLRDASVDVVLMTNVLYMLEHKHEALKEAARILKPTGTLLVIDWNKSPSPVGPPIDQRVPEDSVKQLAGESGLAHQRTLRAGAHHYAMIFSPHG